MIDTTRAVVDREVELGSVVTQVKATSIPSQLPQTSRFVGLEDISSYEGRLSSISTVAAVRSRVSAFLAGDVLYARLRPYLRKTVVASFDGFASAEMLILRCSGVILPNYLLMLLLSDAFADFVGSRTKGDRPRTSFQVASKFRFSLPSLEAQEQICNQYGRLDDAFGDLRNAVDEHRRTTDLLLSSARSTLIWGPHSGPRLVPFSQLVAGIDYGTAKKSDYAAPGTPVLRIPNLTDTHEIDSSDVKFTLLNESETDKYSLAVDDVLMIRSNGSLPLVGRVAKVEKAHEGFAFAGYLLRIRPQKHVRADYLVELAQTRKFRELVEAAARSSTGINNLSASRLSAFLVPLADERRQNQILDRLSRLQAASSLGNYEMGRALKQAETLRATARSIWLGSRLSRTDGTPVIPESPRESATENAEPAGRSASSLSDAIMQYVGSSGATSFDPRSIARQTGSEEEEVRDTLFALLSADPPRLVQSYDDAKSAIVLRQVQ